MAQELGSSAQNILTARFGVEELRDIPASMVNETGTIALLLGMALDAQKVTLPDSLVIFSNVEKAFLQKGVTLNSKDPLQNFEVNELIMHQIAALAA